MRSLMTSSMTRSQDDIESKTTTLSKTEQVSETTTSWKAQNAQIIKTSSERDTTSSENLNVNVQSDEYERLLTTKKKVEQIREIQLLREQKDQEWSAIFILPLHSKNAERAQSESISMSVRDLVMSSLAVGLGFGQKFKPDPRVGVRPGWTDQSSQSDPRVGVRRVLPSLSETSYM
jgi:hypothetical protein